VVISVVKKGQFWVVISVVKKSQFWVVITVVKERRFWVVIRVVKKRQLLRLLPDENRRDANLHRGHKITGATGLLQDNACGHDLVEFTQVFLVFTLFLCFMFTKSVSNYSGFVIDAMDRAIN